MSHDGQNCQACHYYDERQAECRRHAPGLKPSEIVYNAEGKRQGETLPYRQFPRMPRDGWCGDFVRAGPGARA